MPRRPLGYCEAVALGSRLLVVFGIQGYDSTRRAYGSEAGAKRGDSRAPQRRRRKGPANDAVSSILHVLFIMEMVHPVAAAQNSFACSKNVPSKANATIEDKQPARK